MIMSADVAIFKETFKQTNIGDFQSFLQGPGTGGMGVHAGGYVTEVSIFVIPTNTMFRHFTISGDPGGDFL